MIPSAPAKETQHPDVKKLFAEATLPASVWMTFMLLADKLVGLETWEKEQARINGRTGKGSGVRVLVSY